MPARPLRLPRLLAGQLDAVTCGSSCARSAYLGRHRLLRTLAYVWFAHHITSGATAVAAAAALPAGMPPYFASLCATACGVTPRATVWHFAIGAAFAFVGVTRLDGSAVALKYLRGEHKTAASAYQATAEYGLALRGIGADAASFKTRRRCAT